MSTSYDLEEVVITCDKKGKLISLEIPKNVVVTIDTDTSTFSNKGFDTQILYEGVHHFTR